MKFGTDIHVPLKINPDYFGNPLTFYLTLTASQST